MERAFALAAGADVLLCIGSSLEVYPIAQLPALTRAGRRRGRDRHAGRRRRSTDAADGEARRRRRRRARGARRRAVDWRPEALTVAVSDGLRARDPAAARARSAASMRPSASLDGVDRPRRPGRRRSARVRRVADRAAVRRAAPRAGSGMSPRSRHALELGDRRLERDAQLQRRLAQAAARRGRPGAQRRAPRRPAPRRGRRAGRRGAPAGAAPAARLRRAARAARRGSTASVQRPSATSSPRP